MKSNRNRNIWLMYGIALLQGMVFYGPVATLYRQAVGVTIFQITIIESISLALCLILELPWGIVADRIGYKKTMLFCCILYFLSKIVFWKAEGFGWFLTERIMLSVVIAGFSGVDHSILYMSCEKGQSQKVFGIYNYLNTLGLLLASAVFAIFVGDNFRFAGFLTVCSYGLAMILSAGLLEIKPDYSLDKSKEEGSHFSSFLSILKKKFTNKSTILFLIAIALLNETHQTITVFLNQLQYVRGGLSTHKIGFIYIIITLTGLLGIFSRRLTNFLGTMKTAYLLFSVAIIACIVLFLTGNPWLSVGSILLLRVCFSLFQPLQMELQNQQVITKNRATELSINALIIDGTAIGTNLIFGKLAETNVAHAMLMGVLFCTLGLIFFYFWGRSRKRS